MRGMMPRLGSSSIRKRGPRHERARDREHLALAARERAGPLAHALPQHREEREDALEHLLAPLRVAVAERAEPQIVGDGEAAEEPATLGHERDAEVDAVGRLDRVDALPSNQISPLRGVRSPAMVFSSVVLPAPLAPTSATASPAATSQGHALQRDDARAVGDVRVAHLEHRAVRRGLAC